LRGFPRNWARQSVVHLEDAGSVAIAFERSPVSGGQTFSGDLQQLPRGDIAKREIELAKGAEVCNRLGDMHLSPKLGEMSAQRVGNRLRTTARNGPSHSVGNRSEDDAERRGERFLERQDRVRGQSRPQRPRPRVAKPELSGSAGGRKSQQSQPRQQKRASRQQAHRPQDLRRQLLPTLREWPEQPQPLLAVL